MAQANFCKGTEMYQKFQDYWTFIKMFGTAEDNDKYWEEIMESGNQLIEKYDRDQFMYDLIMAFINQQDRESNKIHKIKCG